MIGSVVDRSVAGVRDNRDRWSLMALLAHAPLAVALGLAPEQLNALKRVPGDVVEERFDAQGFADLHLTRPFEQVLAQYGVRGPDNVGVLMMTGLLGAGQG